MSIFDTIDLIQKRPGMFIGSNSITSLFHYLNGYQAAELENGIYRKGELFPLPFRYMHEYTGYRLKEHSTAGWYHLILNSCNGAEDIALQKFFEFYNDFKQVRMKRYWKAILSEDNIAWNNQMKRAYRYTGPNTSSGLGLYTLDDLLDKEPVYHNPLAVYVIELSIFAYILIVETEFDIRLEYEFFVSPDKAQGGGTFPEGAGIYFGSIDTWEEYTAESISFNKKLII